MQSPRRAWWKRRVHRMLAWANPWFSNYRWHPKNFCRQGLDPSNISRWWSFKPHKNLFELHPGISAGCWSIIAAVQFNPFKLPLTLTFKHVVNNLVKEAPILYHHQDVLFWMKKARYSLSDPPQWPGKIHAERKGNVRWNTKTPYVFIRTKQN